MLNIVFPYNIGILNLSSGNVLNIWKGMGKKPILVGTSGEISNILYSLFNYIDSIFLDNTLLFITIYIFSTFNTGGDLISIENLR